MTEIIYQRSTDENLKDQCESISTGTSSVIIENVKNKFLESVAVILTEDESYQLSYLLKFHENYYLIPIFSGLFVNQKATLWGQQIQQELLRTLYQKFLKLCCLDAQNLSDFFKEPIDISIKNLLVTLSVKWINYDYNDNDNEFFTKELKKLASRLDKTYQKETILKINAIGKLTEQFFDFQYMFKRAFLNAEEQDDLSQWLEIISRMLDKLEKYSEKISFSLPYLTNLLEGMVDFDDLERFGELIEQTRCENWLNYLLTEQLNQDIDALVGNIYKDSDMVESYKSKFRTKVDEFSFSPSLLKVLATKIKKEVQLLDQTRSLDLTELLEIFAAIKPSIVTDSVVLRLKNKPLSCWKEELRYSEIINQLPLTDKAQVKQRKKCAECLIELCNKYSFEFVSQLTQIISKKKSMNYLILNSVLDKILRGVWQLDNQIIQELEIRELMNWEIYFQSLNREYKPIELKEIVGILNSQCVPSDKETFGFCYEEKALLSLEEKIMEASNGISDELGLNYFFQKKIKDWQTEDFLNWSKHIRQTDPTWVTQHIYYTLAVIGQAICVDSKGSIYPRITQYSAVWLFFCKPKARKGRLGQISTGEGKTLITAMLALLKILSGESVDIITSNSVLAIRDSKKNEALFALFGIEISNNCDEKCQRDSKERQDRYRRCNVIYGDIGSFQRDLLLTESLDVNTQSGRDAKSIIVDEVDSMLLDKGDNVLYLSHSISDLRYLRRLYIEIWSAVHGSDYEEMDSNIAILKVVEYLRNRLDSVDLTFNIPVPDFLKEFIEMRLTLWVKSAFIAKYMKEKDQYVIVSGMDGEEGEKIIVMDKDTGVEQSQMQYSNGLHQFLQLKYTQKITTESLKAIFISNYSYFKRKNHIYGLTGTLGSKADRSFLQKIYGVDFFQMPRYQKSRFIEEDSLICATIADWKKTIQKEIEEKILPSTDFNQRTVLVICENVDIAESLLEFSKNDTRISEHAYTYVSAYKEFKMGSDKECPLTPGKVIFATNLAGRGLDLVIDDILNENGGIHVILTYLPKNKRIEEQAFGRAARKDQKGSGMFVLMHPEPGVILEQLKRARDLNEEIHVKDIIDNLLPAMTIEEELCNKFLEFYKQIKENFQKVDSRKYGEGYIDLQLKSLTDHWAFWLDSMGEKIKLVRIWKQQTFFDEFDRFKSDIQKMMEETCVYKLVRSPHELVALGKYFIEKNRFLAEAIHCFDQVIKQDEYCSENAYRYKIYCHLKLLNLDNFSNRREVSKFTKKSHTFCVDSMHELILTQKQVQGIALIRQARGQGMSRNRYSDQIENECKLLNLHKRSMEEMSGFIIDASFFDNILSLKETGYVSEAYERLYSHPALFKTYRLSKKVAINEHSGRKKLLLKEGKKFVEIEIPKIFSYCRDELFDFFQNKIGKDITTRQIEAQEFKSFTLGRNTFWSLLKKYGLLIQETEIKNAIINISKELDFNKLCTVEKYHHQKIRAILHANCYRPLTQKLFPELRGTRFNELEEFLISNNCITKISSGILLICFDPETGDMILPASLEKYRDIIEPITESPILEKCQDNSLKFSIAFEELPLPTDDLAASRQLWMILQDLRIIKKPVVNFSWKSISNPGESVKKQKEIKKIIKEEMGSFFSGKDRFHLWLFEKFDRAKSSEIKGNAIILTNAGVAYFILDGICELRDEKPRSVTGINRKELRIVQAGEIKKVEEPKELVDKIIKSALEKGEHTKYPENRRKIIKVVSRELIKSVGLLKTLETIEPHFKPIEEYFKMGDYSPEINYFKTIMWDQVLILQEKRNYYGQIFVFSLGIIQLIAGLVLEAVSMGMATHVAEVLINEGIGDLIYSIQAMVNGNFSWREYLKYKAISVSLSVATLGIRHFTTPAASTVKTTARSTFQIFKQVGHRFLEEASKSICIGLTNAALDSFFEQLPSEIVSEFGTQIHNFINDSKENQRLVENVRNKMVRIYQLAGGDQAENVLKEKFDDAMSNLQKQSKTQRWFNLILDITQQINSCVMMHVERCSDLLLQNRLFMITKIVRTVIPLAKSTPEIYKLFHYYTDFFSALDRELQVVINDISGDQQEEKLSADCLSKIDKVLDSTRENLVKTLITGISDQLIKPGITQGIQNVIQHLYSSLSKKNSNASSAEENEQKNQGTERSADYDEPFPREEKSGDGSQKPSILDTSEIVTLKNVDLNVPISNEGNLPLKEVIKKEGNPDMLYKNAKGERVFHSKDHASTGEKRHKKRHRNQPKQKRSVHRYSSKGEKILDKPSHKHPRNQRKFDKLKNHPDIKQENGNIQYRGIPNSIISRSHNGNSHPVSQKFARNSHSHHRKNRMRHKGRVFPILREEGLSVEPMKRGRWWNNRPEEKKFCRNLDKSSKSDTTRFFQELERKLPENIITRDSKQELPKWSPTVTHFESSRYRDQPNRIMIALTMTNIISKIAETKLLIAHDCQMDYYNYRIKCTKLEILAIKLKTLKESKDAEFKREIAEINFQSQQQSLQRDQISREIEAEIIKFRSELEVLEKNIKLSFIAELDKFRDGMDNIGDIINFIHSQIQLMRELDAYVTCGSQRLNEIFKKCLEDFHHQILEKNPSRERDFQELLSRLNPYNDRIVSFNLN